MWHKKLFVKKSTQIINKPTIVYFIECDIWKDI